MACLRATLDYRMTSLIGAIPPGERDWGRLLDALGYDRSDPRLAVRQAEIEADIRELDEFHAPLGGGDADASGQGF
jgi:hypothetical protein